MCFGLATQLLAFKILLWNDVKKRDIYCYGRSLNLLKLFQQTKKKSFFLRMFVLFNITLSLKILSHIESQDPYLCLRVVIKVNKILSTKLKKKKPVNS